MTEFSITGVAPVIEFLDKLGPRTATNVDRAVMRWTDRLSGIAQNKASGALLKPGSGDLRAAIAHGTGITSKPGGIVGYVGVRGASAEVAKIAGVQEFGASIPAHIARALGAGKMKFAINGAFLFRSKVSIPAVTIPERSFLRSSLDEIRGPALSDIAKSAQPFWGVL